MAKLDGAFELLALGVCYSMELEGLFELAIANVTTRGQIAEHPFGASTKTVCLNVTDRATEAAIDVGAATIGAKNIGRNISLSIKDMSCIYIYEHRIMIDMLLLMMIKRAKKCGRERG